MEIRIFDVEHGSCALITTPNNRTILVDCGHNDTTGFRPSDYLTNVMDLDSENNRLSKLIVSNVDQDHLSDLLNIREEVNPEILSRNPKLDRNFVNEVKEEMTDEFEEYLDMHETYNEPIDDDWGGVIITPFYHDPDKFSDTNNLSLVKFFEYGGLKIIFPGDLEKAGWSEFLKDESFVEHLKTTKVLVASHHGRESGYCADIFHFCKPEIIIISDEDVKYDTQRDIGYSEKATGIIFDGKNHKKILTTRTNGMITLKAESTFYNVSIER